MTSSTADQHLAAAALSAPTGRAENAGPIHRAWVLLGCLVAAVAALNYFWLSLNTVPPHWDAANHMISALRYHDVLSRCGGQPHITLHGLKHCAGELIVVDQSVYPPLFPLTGGLVIFLAGRSITALTMTNLPFIALLVTATYLVGRKIHSHLAGVLAALLIVAYPLVFQMSREFMLEFAIIAMSAVAAGFLLLADGFKKPGATLLFGITTGLGALSKFTLLTYVIGPGLYVFGRLMTDLFRRRISAYQAARRVLTLAGALVLGLAVAALWYWPNREAFLGGLRAAVSLDLIGAPVLSLPSLMYYPTTMIWTQMGPPLFLLFIFGAMRLTRHVTREHRDFLLVWMVSIFVIQTAVSHKGPHDDVGILVPVALISAVGIASLSHWRAAVAVVSCFVLLQLAILTLPASVLGAHVGTFGWTGVGPPFPRTEDWKLENVLEDLAARPARVAVVSDHMFVNGTTLEFYALKNDLPLAITPCFKVGRQADPSDFSHFDVVIAKSDDAWIRPKADGCYRGPNGRAEYAAVIQGLEDHSKGFVLIRSVALPDGSSLLVFSAETRDARTRQGRGANLAPWPS